jgi:hypothetical protein
MPEIFYHRRELFPQRESKPVVKMISGRNAVGDGVSLAQQYVTSDFMYQNMLSLFFLWLTKKFANRNAFGSAFRINA